MSDLRSPDYDEKRDEAPTLAPRNPTGRITPVLEPNEARGGVTHHNVRTILAVSLFAVVIAMAIAWLFFFPAPGAVQTTLPENPATLSEPAPTAEP
jgi:hypothetical protein